jgi:predicted secreted protein
VARFTLLLGAALAALATLAGCASLTVDNPFVPAPTFVRLDEASAAPLTLARGQSIVVTLPANIPTGYRWEPTAGFAPTLQLTGTPDYTMPPGVGGAAASAGPAQPVATVPIGQIAWTPRPVPVGATAESMAASEKPVPVGDGQMTFIFLAATAGTASLELAYRRPFEPNVSPAKTIRYDVTVR